jgi:hypothetical protein
MVLDQCPLSGDETQTSVTDTQIPHILVVRAALSTHTTCPYN